MAASFRLSNWLWMCGNHLTKCCEHVLVAFNAHGMERKLLVMRHSRENNSNVMVKSQNILWSPDIMITWKTWSYLTKILQYTALSYRQEVVFFTCSAFRCVCQQCLPVVQGVTLIKLSCLHFKESSNLVTEGLWLKVIALKVPTVFVENTKLIWPVRPHSDSTGQTIYSHCLKKTTML